MPKSKLRKAAFEQTGRTKHDAHVEFLLQKLHTCVSEHEICRSDFYGTPRDPNHQPRLPSRILFVGGHQADAPGGSQGHGVKLVEQRPDAQGQGPLVGRYIALSHCWGPPEKHSITTTTVNIDRHRAEGIPFDSLSKTFQDATTITRKLGVEYLWIDSLCIVQDDRDDWESEAPRMGFVYEDAYLTICATGAADGTEGCFAVAEDEDAPARLDRVYTNRGSVECLPPYETSSGEVNKYKARGLQSHFLGPLQDRAWITQEWILSPRQIHYCRGQLAWCCDTVQMYDDGSHLTLLIRYDLQGYMKVFTSHNQSFPGLGVVSWVKVTDPRRARIAAAWKWIVQEYTARNLTKVSDKLAAMQGLIQKMQGSDPAVGSNKFACPYGIMSYELPYSLAWSRRELPKGRYLHRPQELKAMGMPSWSWASTTGSIDYTRELGQDIGPICQCCRYDSDIKALIIKSGLIIVGKPLSLFAYGRKHSIMLDESGGVDNLDKVLNGQDGEYLMIPIIHAKDTQEVPYHRDKYHCLIARPSKDRAGAFERIGIGWFFEWERLSMHSSLRDTRLAPWQLPYCNVIDTSQILLV